MHDLGDPLLCKIWPHHSLLYSNENKKGFLTVMYNSNKGMCKPQVTNDVIATEEGNFYRLYFLDAVIVSFFVHHQLLAIPLIRRAKKRPDPQE